MLQSELFSTGTGKYTIIKVPKMDLYYSILMYIILIIAYVSLNLSSCFHPLSN